MSRQPIAGAGIQHWEPTAVHRMCSGKQRYTKRDAHAMAKHKSRTLDKPLRIYECPICSGWHITKSEAR